MKNSTDNLTRGTIY